MYNKKLLADAGITEVPKTTAQMDDAITKLEAKGITPFANAYKEWWVWKHIFQHFVDAAAQDAGTDAKTLVNDFIAGKTTIKDHRCCTITSSASLIPLLNMAQTNRLNGTAMLKSATLHPAKQRS